MPVNLRMSNLNQAPLAAEFVLSWLVESPEISDLFCEKPKQVSVDAASRLAADLSRDIQFQAIMRPAELAADVAYV